MYAAQLEETIEMSESEYLVFDAESEIKHEYRKGQVYAMTGGSVRHGIITANTIIHLGNKLSGKDCTVTSPDVRVHIASKGTYRYPDVTVFCGDPSYLDGRTDTIINPIILVEVLSPATALKDRNEKLEEYIQIETLQAYLLVSQDEARVERYMRHETGEWLYSIARGLENELALPFIECTLNLSNVYQKVTFETPDA
ncbi:MAG: Uma2 family endonuclease [Aggregatilineales bacterium]